MSLDIEMPFLGSLHLKLASAATLDLLPRTGHVGSRR